MLDPVLFEENGSQFVGDESNRQTPEVCDHRAVVVATIPFVFIGVLIVVLIVAGIGDKPSVRPATTTRIERPVAATAAAS